MAASTSFPARYLAIAIANIAGGYSALYIVSQILRSAHRSIFWSFLLYFLLFHLISGHRPPSQNIDGNWPDATSIEANFSIFWCCRDGLVLTCLLRLKNKSLDRGIRRCQSYGSELALRIVLIFLLYHQLVTFVKLN